MKEGKDAKGRILVLSDSSTTATGYSNVATNIMNHMVDADWEVDYMGHNYVGKTLIPPIKFEVEENLNLNFMEMA